MRMRALALEEMVKHGDVYVRHNYGYQTKDHVFPYPVSSQDPALGFQWFGGRLRELYRDLPETQQPYVVIGECKSSDALNHPDTITDVINLDQIYRHSVDDGQNNARADRKIKWASWYTFGQSWGASGYEMNELIDQFEAAARAAYQK